MQAPKKNIRLTGNGAQKARREAETRARAGKEEGKGQKG